jgi:uncharacterized membrane protein YfcA
LIGYLITGLLFGIIGGMGMGGGIILIPALTLIFGVRQHDAQSINLIVFLPMAAAALFLHIKNRLVDMKKAVFLSISGLAGAWLGTNLAIILDENVLKKAFGIFLIALAGFRFFKSVKDAKKKRK